MKSPLQTVCYINPIALGLVFILTCGCFKGQEPASVILLTLDTLRADALGCYGNKTIRTPAIDRLAREGVWFEDAVCQIPATLTSHTAMMTGRYPKTTGVRFRTHKVSPNEETLAEIYSRHNYHTAALISSVVLQPDFGLNQGFERYDLGTMIKDGRQVHNERRAEETIEDAIEYTIRHAGEPYFLWVHLYDPHTPYDSPNGLHGLYDSDYNGPVRGSVNEIIRLNAEQGEGLTPRDFKHLQALYWSEVTYMDKQIGRLIEALESRGQLDDVIIAVISDHGENLGEKGHFFHGETLYRSEIRIPFIIRYPPKIAKGQQVERLVQSIDLFPTLLELSEAAPVPAYVEGRSLAPLITGQNQAPPKRPGFLETEADTVVQGNKLYGLRTENHKFIYNTNHRRRETPLGLFTQIPVKGPSIVLMRIKGGPSVRLMAHVRYRTEELYASQDEAALAKLPSTVVYAETYGTEPLHREAQAQDNFLPTPEGWRLQATPDIYKLAKGYGQARGWPTEWMVIEGVGVDAALPHEQKQGEFVVDQIELYTQSLRFPDTPQFRDPFWVIADFEAPNAEAFKDSGEGPAHHTRFERTREPVLNGKQQLEITIEFEEHSEDINELYQLHADPYETRNLLDPLTPEAEAMAGSLALLLDDWLWQEPGQPEMVDMDAQKREALESLGYTQQ